MLLEKKTSCFVGGCSGTMKREEFPPSQYSFLADGQFNLREYKKGEVFAQHTCTTCDAKHKYYATSDGYPCSHTYHYPNGLVRIY